MQQVLSVAEKPSVAKELANIIGNGRGSSRNGMSRFNRLFDVGECEVGGGIGKCEMTITSVLGHVMDINFTEANKPWLGSAQKLEELFDAPIRKSVKSESVDLVRTIQSEARRCSVLMLWLDGDLEGENISYEVLGLCQEVNPRIRVLRARFSALIPRDIFRTLRNPDSLNPHMNDAICARQEIDLRIGAAFTRFLTLRCQNRYEEVANKGVISYGPCQFPTLGFVVDRFFNVQNFVPEKFWSLHCEARKHDVAGGGSTCPASTSFHWQRGNVFDRFTVTVLYDLCMKNIGFARVLDVSGSASKRHRPPPLNTVALQMKASQYCRMSSAETMEVAEKLYQQGILSYPRTETDYFKEGTDLTVLIDEHKGHSVWGSFARKLLEPAQPPQEPFFLWPKPGGHDDEAHPPIHPTKCVELSTLDPRERQLYELVVRHFLACCSRDAEGSTTTAKILIPTVAGGAADASTNTSNGTPSAQLPPNAVGELFSASGTVIKQRNYLEIYKYEKWHGSEIPDFAVGELAQVVKLEMTAGKTNAPLPLSESDLISEMDRNKIGTDATIATHIGTIISREYATMDTSGGGNRLIPTALGTALCEAFNSMGYQLNKPFFRAQMERDCTRIARGDLQKTQMLRDCLSTMKGILRKCVQEVHLLDAAMARHFRPLGRPAGAGEGNAFTVLSAQFGRCGRCQSSLELRQTVDTGGQGERGDQRSPLRYLYCATCPLSLALPRSGTFQPLINNTTRAPVICPLCQFQVITVTPVDTGVAGAKKKGPHHVCSYCFSNPPPPPDAEDGVLVDFRCFTCAHGHCDLAGRATQVQGGIVSCNLAAGGTCCPDGLIQLKRGDRSYSVGCSKYPNCGNKFSSKWLPKAVKNAVPVEAETCVKCSQSVQFPVVKVRLELVSAMLPMHLRGDPTRSVCLCCSSFWTDMDETAPLAGLVAGVGTAGSGGGAPQQQANMSNFLNGYHMMRNNPAPTAAAAAAAGPASTSASSRTGRAGNMQVDYERGSAGSENDYAAAAVGIKHSNRSYGSGAGAGAGGAKAAWADGTDANGPVCTCGVPSVKRSVTRETQNKGRMFYTCHDKDNGCRFFEWADEGGAGSGMAGGGGGGQSTYGGYGGNQDSGRYAGAESSAGRSSGGRGGRGGGRWGGRYSKKK